MIFISDLQILKLMAGHRYYSSLEMLGTFLELFSKWNRDDESGEHGVLLRPENKGMPCKTFSCSNSVAYFYIIGNQTMENKMHVMACSRSSELIFFYRVLSRAQKLEK